MSEEDYFETDEEGKLLIPLQLDMPAEDGKLNIAVSLIEDEIYGTVIDNLIVENNHPKTSSTTFYDRTMWAPPSKTPLFLLIVPNLLLLTVWSLIVYLIFILFKIRKSL